MNANPGLIRQCCSRVSCCACPAHALCVVWTRTAGLKETVSRPCLNLSVQTSGIVSCHWLVVACSGKPSLPWAQHSVFVKPKHITSTRPPARISQHDVPCTVRIGILELKQRKEEGKATDLAKTVRSQGDAVGMSSWDGAHVR